MGCLRRGRPAADAIVDSAPTGKVYAGQCGGIEPQRGAALHRGRAVSDVALAGWRVVRMAQVSMARPGCPPDLLRRQIFEKEIEIFHGWLFNGRRGVQQNQVVELAGNALLDLARPVELCAFFPV